MNEKFISKGIICSYDLHSCNGNLLKICISHTQVIRVHISVVVPSTKPNVFCPLFPVHYPLCWIFKMHFRLKRRRITGTTYKKCLKIFRLFKMSVIVTV